MRLLTCILAAAVAAGCSSASEPGGQTSTDAIGASLAGRRPFPGDNPWNTIITSAPVDPSSSTLIASCGLRNLHPDFGTVWNGAPNGIPYIVGRAGQPKVPVSFDYADESDPGPVPHFTPPHPAQRGAGP